MLRFLERLQARPERERAMISVLTAGSITAIIFLAWVVAVGARIAGEAPAPVTDDESPARISDLIRDTGTLDYFSQAASVSVPTGEPPADVSDAAEVTPESAEPSAEPESQLLNEPLPVDTPVRITPAGDYEIR